MSRASTSSPSGPATVGLLPSAAALLPPSSAQLPPSGGRLPASLALAFWRLPSPSPVAFWPRPFASPLSGSAELFARPSVSLPAWSGRTPVRTPPRTPQATARPVPPPTPEPTSFAHGPLLRLLVSVVAAKTTPIHRSAWKGDSPKSLSGMVHIHNPYSP